MDIKDFIKEPILELKNEAKEIANKLLNGLSLDDPCLSILVAEEVINGLNVSYDSVIGKFTEKIGSEIAKLSYEISNKVKSQTNVNDFGVYKSERCLSIQILEDSTYNIEFGNDYEDYIKISGEFNLPYKIYVDSDLNNISAVGIEVIYTKLKNILFELSNINNLLDQ